MARRRARRTTKKDRYFVLQQSGKDTDHVFKGSQPRRAALKAATRGFKDIRLRERGTQKVHVFKGSRAKVKAPADRPSWLPSTVWKPSVRKVGVVHLKTKAAVKKKKVRRKKAVKRKTTKRKTTKKKAAKKKTTKKKTTKKKAVKRKTTKRKATKRKTTTKRRRRR